MLAPNSLDIQAIPLPLRPPAQCRVLIVDDDERIVDALSSILSRDGYQLLSAATGNRAITLMLNERPDVSIVDVLLPDVDGIEVCRRIKSQAEHRSQMIILMTGFSARSRRLEGLDAGADDFLSKPIDPVELMARVRALLRTKQLYDEVESHRADLERRVAARTQQLRDANLRLEELNQVKSNILGIVSHELRTPLMKIKSGLWLALQDNIAPAERDRVRGVAEAACNLLEYRIADFAVFTDPSALTLNPASISDVIWSAVDQVRILQSGAESLLQVDLPDQAPPVMVDPASITRALAHVIDNAIKFGGAKPPHVRASVVEGAIKVEIQDRGIGMDEELLSQVFAPLKQGDESATRRHGGLGMGLALVRLILDAHQATIDIQSEVNVGTTVTIMLPVMTDPRHKLLGHSQ